jgi:hypothetical protein
MINILLHGRIVWGYFEGEVYTFTEYGSLSVPESGDSMMVGVDEQLVPASYDRRTTGVCAEEVNVTGVILRRSCDTQAFLWIFLWPCQ